MRERPTLDVSDLPTVAFGARASIWWGAVGLMAIEGTMFAIMAASYFYLRGNAAEWPPTGAFHPGLMLTTINLAILLGSMIPMHYAAKAAHEENLDGIRRSLIVATVLIAAVIVLRFVILSRLTYRWDSHAYGSLIWTTAGLHALHLITGLVENLLFIVLLIKGPVEDKHLVDVRVNTLYWYFVALSWVPFYVIFFLDPGLLNLSY
ncbi:MAG TPA: cytochrome c oxidase subunit 3 [Thermoanaerobaculia bacterium]|nr:cytochrome c oxidase subunit 3 [Thermoanaerobaculia bacterium]